MVATDGVITEDVHLIATLLSACTTFCGASERLEEKRDTQTKLESGAKRI